MSNFPRDILGREIKPGQYIAYAVRSGNSGSMQFGKVIEAKIVAKDNPYAGGEIQLDEITILGASRGWSKAALTLNSRKSVLSYGERVCIVSDVPEDIKAQFEEGKGVATI